MPEVVISFHPPREVYANSADDESAALEVRSPACRLGVASISAAEAGHQNGRKVDRLVLQALQEELHNLLGAALFPRQRMLFLSCAGEGV